MKSESLTIRYLKQVDSLLEQAYENTSYIKVRAIITGARAHVAMALDNIAAYKAGSRGTTQ
jgi:hypothetical protein